MSSNPKWWQLYLLLPLAVVLFVLERGLPFPTSGHQVVQIGIVLVIFGLVYFWLRANSAALTETEQERHQWKATLIVSVIPNPPDGEARGGNGRQPELPLPKPESKSEPESETKSNEPKSKNALDNTSELDPVEPIPTVFYTHEILKEETYARTISPGDRIAGFADSNNGSHLPARRDGCGSGRSSAPGQRQPDHT
jgi:hypothetical protein